MKKQNYFISLLMVGLLGTQISADGKESSSADERIAQECKALFQTYRETKEQRMEWWEDGRFGMFIHWGAYSQLAGSWKGAPARGYAEHIKRTMEIPMDEYMAEAVEKFNPVLFDADEWVKVCKSGGMKYLVITSKHHDGLAMWHSKNPYNVVDATPFKRDPLVELRDACKRHGIHFCVYYSHAQEWSHPGGQRNPTDYPWHPAEKEINGVRWWNNPDYKDHIARTRKYVSEKSIPQMLEVIETLQPDLIWFDTSGWLPPVEINRIYLACRTADPDVIISGRVGGGWHDYRSTADKPSGFPPINTRYWEAIPTTNESYGYHAMDHGHKPASHFIDLLVGCVSKGGNLLLNVGPKGDGTIAQIDQDIFAGVGAWVKVNQESIYGCTASSLPKQNWGYTTAPDEPDCKRVYLHVKEWPKDGKLAVSGLKAMPVSVTALADSSLTFKTAQLKSGLVAIKLPSDELLQTPFTTLRLDFSQPLSVENEKVRFLHTNTEKNHLHVFDDVILKGGNLKFGLGHAKDMTVERWTSPEKSAQWKVYASGKQRWSVGVRYQAMQFKGRHSKSLNAPYLEKLKKVKVTVSVNGQALTSVLNLGDLDEIDGYAEDILGVLELPEGEHLVEVTASGMSKEVPFRLNAVNLRPVE